MTQTLHDTLAEWRDADRKASAAEKSLTRLLFTRLEDPPPPAGLAVEVRLLREIANEKLKAAIAALKPAR
jgi:hypothetical protein